MPIYEYRCENGHTFEVVQRMIDDPVTTCTKCGSAVERVFHPIAVHFKGSGFYTTDYARKGAKDGAKAASGDGSSGSGGEGSRDNSTGEGKKSDEKKSGRESAGEKKSGAATGD